MSMVRCVTAAVVLVMCAANGRAAEHPAWEELVALLGERRDSAKVTEFAKRYALEEGWDHGRGTFKRPDGVIELSYERERINRIWVRVSGGRNERVYEGALPWGLMATDGRAAVQRKTGTLEGRDVHVTLNEKGTRIEELVVQVQEKERNMRWPEGGWVMPREDAEKWAGRVRRTLPEGWAVVVEGNDVVVRREKGIKWAESSSGGSLFGGAGAGRRERPRISDGEYRLRLMFAPAMSIEKYERLTAVNDATSKEMRRIRIELLKGISHKNNYLPGTREQEARVTAYEEAVEKLRYHVLPEMYCEGYSVGVRGSEGGWGREVHGRADAKECEGVKAAVLRLFAAYEPKEAGAPIYITSDEPSRTDGRATAMPPAAPNE